MAGDPGTFETREREAWKPTHVDLVGSQTGGSADRIVIRKFDVRELLTAVILKLVDHHCQHLGHCVIHTLQPTAVVWVVGAGGNFPNPKKIADSMRKL